MMMQFLSSMLREEGGFDYKKAIVNTIIAIVDENGEAKEAGLSHLCEFIEDCEHTVRSPGHLVGFRLNSLDSCIIAIMTHYHASAPL